MAREHSEERLEPQEASAEQHEFGKNIRVRLRFMRHAHKEVLATHTPEGVISESGISEKGRLAAHAKGKDTLPQGNRLKAHISAKERSDQTAKAFVAGAQEKGVHVYKTRTQRSLDAPHFSSKYVHEEYEPQYVPLPENFDELSPDEQEQLIEDREAPAVSYWLEDWERKSDQETESAQEVAQRIAAWIAKKEHLVRKLYAGSQVEFLAVTHRTTTEPFLVAALGKSLEELGGPLELLEDWTLDMILDEQGRETLTLHFRGNEYPLERDVVESLTK